MYIVTTFIIFMKHKVLDLQLHRTIPTIISIMQIRILLYKNVGYRLSITVTLSYMVFLVQPIRISGAHLLAI